MKTQKIDLSKTQQEMNNLVEKRLDINRQISKIDNEHDSIKNSIKSLKKERDAIDDLFQEKLDELNKYRGISKTSEAD